MQSSPRRKRPLPDDRSCIGEKSPIKLARMCRLPPVLRCRPLWHPLFNVTVRKYIERLLLAPPRLSVCPSVLNSWLFRRDSLACTAKADLRLIDRDGDRLLFRCTGLARLIPSYAPCALPCVVQHRRLARLILNWEKHRTVERTSIRGSV